MKLIDHKALPALVALSLVSCTEPAAEKTGDKPVSGTRPAIETGCYLGQQSAGGDSVLIRIDGAQDGQLAGRMEISIPEKDRRSGSLNGTAGMDGIVRATYRFMQEGIADSVQVQFRQEAGTKALRLRPSAYDPASGREYPDSAKDFSLVLSAVPCK